VILCPTRHKIGHFRDISPGKFLGSVWKKLNLTQQKHTFTNQKKCTTTQKSQVHRLLRHLLGNAAGLFSKEKISKGKEEKVKKKRIEGEACNINKQTIYIAPKSKIESRAHYSPEAARDG